MHSLDLLHWHEQETDPSLTHAKQPLSPERFYWDSTSWLFHCIYYPAILWCDVLKQIKRKLLSLVVAMRNRDKHCLKMYQKKTKRKEQKFSSLARYIEHHSHFGAWTLNVTAPPGLGLMVRSIWTGKSEFQRSQLEISAEMHPEVWFLTWKV